MSMKYVYLSQFCVSLYYNFTVPCLPLFRTPMMGLPSQFAFAITPKNKFKNYFVFVSDKGYSHFLTLRLSIKTFLQR